MAKQQVYQFDNGATLIYQKQSVFNGYSFVMGFRSGAQLDGKYKGLSHLLEHLLFRTPSKNVKNNVLTNVLKYSINQNAFTSKDAIMTEFSATSNNVEMALDNIVGTFCNKYFTEAQIAKEVEVIKHEIAMLKDASSGELSAVDALILGLQKEQDKFSKLDLGGSARTLNTVTPAILKRYMERYFNTDNLVISVTSNQSVEKVIELCNKHIFSRLPRAKNEKYIVPFPIVVEFNDLNAYYVVPNPYQYNVSVDLLLRERSTYSENPDKEYAFNVIEEYLFNGIGGIMEDVLREKNSLVYLYSMENLDYGTSKFKVFNAVTNQTKLRKTISEMCKMIREIGENGVPKEKFEIVKNVLTDIQNAKLNKFKACSAMGNYNDFMQGVPFVDYKKAEKYIQNMTYQEFNDYIMPIFQAAQVSLAVEGPVDTRKVYNLVEVEEMLGNYSHSDQWQYLNVPIMQTTQMPDYKTEILNQMAEQLIEGERQQKEIDAAAEQEERGKVITIDNERVN